MNELISTANGKSVISTLTISEQPGLPQHKNISASAASFC